MLKTLRLKYRALPEEWRAVIKRVPWLLLILPALILPALAAKAPAVVEAVYSRGIYPVISAIYNFLFGFFPFSVAEWIFYCALIGVPISVILLLVFTLIRRIRWAAFARLMLTYLIIFCIGFNAFYWLWGFNYSRPVLSETLSLNVRERPVEELETACHALAARANELRAQVAEDENGVFILDESVRECFLRVPEAYLALGQDIPLFNRRVAAPKTVLFSEGMSYLGITGVYFPFTAEANVNIHQHALLLPATAAHESAHALGIAREDEANFMGFLACTASDDVRLQYSGVMLALIHCGNQLSRADSEKYKALRATYSDAVERDLQDHNAYWNAYEGPIQDSMTEMNDSYLRYHRLESGVKSYGEMVDLVLAWYEEFRFPWMA